MKFSTKRAKMSFPKWIIVLVGLKIFPDYNITDLAKEIGVSYTTTFRLISKFAEIKKWITVKKDFTNNRDIRCNLTTKGKIVCNSTISWLRQFGLDPQDKDYFKKLSEPPRHK